MKHQVIIILIILFIANLVFGATTVSFCNDEGMTPYPNPSGWSDFGYCEDEQLYMIVDTKVRNTECKYQKLGKKWEVVQCDLYITKHDKILIPNGNYKKEVTGLACNIAVYKCEVERY